MHTLLCYGDVCTHIHFDQVQIHKEMIESGSRRREGVHTVAALWFNSGVGVGWGVVAQLGSELHGFPESSSHPVSVAFARVCH